MVDELNNQEEATLETILDEANQESVQNDQSTNEIVPPKKLSQQEINFSKLRESKEKLEREHQEALRRIKELQELKESQRQQEELDDIDDPTEKKLKQLEHQVREFQLNSAAQTIEIKLKTNHPDFEDIVNKDNIDKFRSEYPEIADSINSSSDLYKKATATYTLIKKLGIAADPRYDKDKERVLQNTNKPRPLTSVSPQQSESPLSKANAFADGLTPELQQQLYQEMIESSKKY